MEMLLGILQNPAVLFGVGLLVKYFPGFRTMIANRGIPYINMGLALFGALLTLATSAAGTEIKPAIFASWYPEHTQVVVAGFGGAFGGFFDCIKSSVFNAGMAYIANKLLINQIGIRPIDSKR